MAELVFDCIDAQADRYAAGPTLLFRLRIAETTGERVHAVALRCQFRIEPQKRRYSPAETERLVDLFGDSTRWGETLRPLQLANATVMVPSFTGSTEIDVPVPCTYDLEVASTTYFHALDDDEIPLVLLFSGTMFTKGETGFSVSQVPWHKEATYRLPVTQWRAMMDAFFPGSGWLRLSRSALVALGRYKSAHAIPTWEQTIVTLLEQQSAEASP